MEFIRIQYCFSLPALWTKGCCGPYRSQYGPRLFIKIYIQWQFLSGHQWKAERARHLILYPCLSAMDCMKMQEGSPVIFNNIFTGVAMGCGKGGGSQMIIARGVPWSYGILEILSHLCQDQRPIQLRGKPLQFRRHYATLFEAYNAPPAKPNQIAVHSPRGARLKTF